MPTHPFNPFARGFSDLRIQRLLAILYDVDAPLCHRPPHPSQQDMDDDQFSRRQCLFNDEHALVLTAPTTLEEHDAQYSHIGVVVQVIYALFAHYRQPPVLLGDLYSQTVAQLRIKQLAFETGHYSRCWEISSVHLCDAAYNWLVAQTAHHTPTGLLFEVFTLPVSQTLGCKLIDTPWTDANLGDVSDCTAEELRQEQLDAGMPESLVNVLHLAAQADVRILIFDPDAAPLEGLVIYTSDN
ncbi:ABC transporter substrate-binding protein [Pseudomonas batumici]|uniref:DUF5983 family protein n=1 Tax=Pseudomonas batumici TaxID=226910 RepID=UPI0030CC5DF2